MCSGFCASHSVKILLVITIATLLFFAILISVYVGMISSTPQAEKFPIKGEGTFTVTSIVDNKWIGAIKLTLEKLDKEAADGTGIHHCSVEAAVVEDRSCLDLYQVNKKGNVKRLQDILFLFALPGSKLNMTIPVETNYHLWITRSLEEYDRLNNQLFRGGDANMHCIDYPESCFKTKDYTGQVISYSVDSTNYYSYVLTNSTDNSLIDAFSPEGIKYSYELVSINYTAITSNENYYKVIEPKQYIQYGSKPAELNIHSEFNFQKTCPLAHFNCDCSPTLSSYPCFQVVLSGTKPRKDFLTFMTTGAVAVLLAFSSITAAVYCYCHKNKCRIKT